MKQEAKESGLFSENSAISNDKKRLNPLINQMKEVRSGIEELQELLTQKKENKQNSNMSLRSFKQSSDPGKNEKFYIFEIQRK